jgi:hypothetical protein
MPSHRSKFGWYLLGVIAATLSGCKSEKLTEQECLTIQEREIAQISSCQTRLGTQSGFLKELARTLRHVLLASDTRVKTMNALPLLLQTRK